MTIATSSPGQGSTAKWADYCISAVRFNSIHTHIDYLRAAVDKGDSIGPMQDYSRSSIVAAIKQGTTFVTVFRGPDGNFRKGQRVYIVVIRGVDTSGPAKTAVPRTTSTTCQSFKIHWGSTSACSWPLAVSELRINPSAFGQRRGLHGHSPAAYRRLQGDTDGSSQAPSSPWGAAKDTGLGRLPDSPTCAIDALPRIASHQPRPSHIASPRDARWCS